VLDENEPSRRICERLGYQRIRQQVIEEDGSPLVESVYELSQTAWLNRE
jgi:RimJ/RimL family protein N-acetyltransferase